MGRGLFPAGARYRFIVLTGLELVMRYPVCSMFPYMVNHKQSQYWPGFVCFIARPLGCRSNPLHGCSFPYLSPNKQRPGFIVFLFSFYT
jgi:hypothetical protein